MLMHMRKVKCHSFQCNVRIMNRFSLLAAYYQLPKVKYTDQLFMNSLADPANTGSLC